MSEKGGSSHAGIINNFIPHPTIRFVTFWQGIVEIIARGILLLLLLILFATSSAAEDEAQDYPDNSDLYETEVRNAKAAAGFSIFVGVIAFIYEVIFIVCRFLNFVFMTAYRTVVLIVDISFNGVVALLLFASAVSLAYHADFFKGEADKFDAPAVDFFQDILNDLGNQLGAAAFFAFTSLFSIIFIAVWMVLYLVLKWDIGGSGSSSTAES